MSKKIESEKTLEKQLNNGIKKAGGKSIKLSSMYYTGLPDRLIVLPDSRVMFVEVKTTTEKPKPRQIFVHDELRALGQEVWIIDSTETLNTFLKACENDF